MSLTEYAVLDEELETPPEAPKRSPGRPRKEREPVSEGEQAEELASLIEELTKTAVTQAVKEGQKLKAEVMREVEEKARKITEMYAKPQNLCLHVKLGNLPAMKLKNRASKILPELLVQCQIGQAGGNWPMIVGPTGCGKTVAAEQVAETLKLSFDHVNCSEGMSETWLWGRQTPNGFIPGGLWKAFKDGGVFLFDEADAANDNVWLSINTMLANGHAHNPISGETVKRHPSFIAIAATNTNGKGGTGAYTGRSRLDGATLNRFAMFEVVYDKELEQELCPDKKLRETLHEIRKKLGEKKSQDVISTRDLKNAFLQLQAGFSVERILLCLKVRMDKSNHDLFGAPESPESKEVIPF